MLDSNYFGLCGSLSHYSDLLLEREDSHRPWVVSKSSLPLMPSQSQEDEIGGEGKRTFYLLTEGLQISVSRTTALLSKKTVLGC